ncbi:MAG: Wzz/FepE/Etk N-terminal domain-containing protein [Candidatus Tritonobacter lacicola]|nr:Wzz/FepE/Etk N-terminal domain-containing protein [Candidatus Tritonobacter lacicola]
MSVNVSTITGTAKNYVEVIFQRKWLFLAPAIVCFVLAFGISYLMPSQYRTSNLVIIEEQKIRNPLIRGLAVSQSVKERLATLTKTLKSTTRLEAVIKDIGLDSRVDSQLGMNQLVGRFRGNIDVSLVGAKGELLSITCIDRDPVVCQKVVNTITKLFINENIALQEKELNTGIDFLESQKSVYLDKLKEAESELTTYTRKHQEALLSVEAGEKISDVLGTAVAAGNIHVLRLTRYRADVIEQNLRLKTFVAKKNALQERLKRTPEYVISSRVRELSPIMRELNKTLVEKQIRLSRLQIDSTENHPMVRRLKQEIEKTEAELQRKSEETVKQETKSINPVYQDLLGQLSRVEAEIAGIEDRLKLTEIVISELYQEVEDVPEKRQVMSDLQRNYNIYSRRYSDLEDKLQTAYITKRLEEMEAATAFKILDEARVPLVPFKPNRKAMCLIGLVIGMFIGAGLIFLAEATDHSFDDVGEIRAFLDIPVLGSISQILTVEDALFNRSKKRLAYAALIVFTITVLLTVFITVTVKKG